MGSNLFDIADISEIPTLYLDDSAYLKSATASTTYQTLANLVTSVSGSSTDSQYPSAKLFYDTIGNINTVLDSINGEVI